MLTAAVGRLDDVHVRCACPKPLLAVYLSRAGLGTATFMGGVNSANDAAVQRDFVVFVEGLLAAGVARLHIIAHSMGNRLLLGAVHSLRHVLTPEQSGAPSQAPVGGDGTHSGNTPAAATAPPPCARFASVASSCFTLRQISTGARLWLRLAASSVPTCTYHCSQAKFAPRPHRYGFLRPLRAAGL